MHTSVNTERHNVEHVSVNKLNAIKPLPVWKLNMECLHILKKLKTLTNSKNHCSEAIIFRMLINQIAWELDSLCLWLRHHCRHFCLAKFGHLFSLVLDFWACCPVSKFKSSLCRKGDKFCFFPSSITHASIGSFLSGLHIFMSSSSWKVQESQRPQHCSSPLPVQQARLFL